MVHSVINTMRGLRVAPPCGTKADEIRAKHPVREPFEVNSNHLDTKLETKIGIIF